MGAPFAGFRDERGGVAVMAAVGGALACLVAGVGVDTASVVFEARRLQGAADLAALSAANALGQAETVARVVAADNAGEGVTVRTVTGVHVADPSVAPSARFTEGGTPNAARVTVSGPARLVFGRWIMGRETVMVTRSAIAARPAAPPMATLSIGSRLASLDGGLVNQLLGGLTGSQVSLNLMDYRALADADVGLLSFIDALATDLDLTAGDYNALLSHEIDAGRALRILEPLAGGQAGSALNRLGYAADGLTLRVGDLIGLETRAPDSLRGALGVELSALDLAQAIIEVGAGERQVRLNLGAQAGLADLDVRLAIGERPNRSPWLTVTDRGAPIIRTAQARLYLEATTSQKLSGLAHVRLPVLVELAASEARLERIVCSSGRRVDVGVRPGAARVRIAATDKTRLDDFKVDPGGGAATLISVLNLVTVTAKADIEAADQDYRTLNFSEADIVAQRPKTAQARGLITGAVSSLLSRLDVTVKALGLGLGLGDLTGALALLLAPLGPVLDGVVDAVLDLVGLGLGEADVTVHDATCPDARAGRPVLVG